MYNYIGSILKYSNTEYCLLRHLGRDFHADLIIHKIWGYNLIGHSNTAATKSSLHNAASPRSLTTHVIGAGLTCSAPTTTAWATDYTHNLVSL